MVLLNFNKLLVIAIINQIPLSVGVQSVRQKCPVLETKLSNNIKYFQAVNAVRIEAHMNLSRTVVEERTQKEIAVQHALAQARAEMQEKMDSVQVVAVDDPKVTYSVNWTTPGGQNQIVEAIMEGEAEDLEKEMKTE